MGRALESNGLPGEVYAEQKDPHKFFTKGRDTHAKGEIVQGLPKIGCYGAENRQRY